MRWFKFSLLLAILVFDQTILAQQVEFRPVRSGSGQSGKGISFSFTSYDANDGTAVLLEVYKHPSAASARRELKRRIKGAKKIIEQGAKHDKQGRRVGEKVLAIFEPKEGFNQYAMIMWSEGRSLHKISSQRLEYALEFEKGYGADK